MPAEPWALIAGDFVKVGGMDRANYALASRLARTGHEVHLVAHRVCPSLAGLPAVVVHIADRPLGSHLLGRWPLARLGQRIGREVRRAGGRVVVNGSNCAVDDLNWLHIVHAAYRAPMHGSGLRRARIAAIHAADQVAERRRIRRARLILCNSRKTAADVAQHIGLPVPSVAHVVYLGTDPDEFGPVSASERATAREALNLPADRPLVLFVGQLRNSIKNFDTLFEAVRLLRGRSGWDAILLAVGDPGGNHWQRRVDEERLADHIRILGRRSDVPVLLAASDLLVLPSRYDSYGLAAHEALCRGVPALISVGAGVAERVEGDAVAELLFDAIEDPRRLAELMWDWHGAIPAWRDRVRPLSEQLRARTWDVMADDIVRLAASNP